MQFQFPIRPLLRGWLFSAFGWGIFIFALGWQIVNTISLSWPAAFFLFGWVWLLWSILTPLIFILVNRFPIERKQWKLTVPIHLGACLSLLFIFGLCLPMVDAILLTADVKTVLPKLSLPGRMFFGPHFPVYLLILSAGHALYFYRRGRERELKALELTTSLAEARLRSLQMQIQPHFLFNSLNALGTLIHKDANAAEEMLAALADFLRLTLDDCSGQEVRLRRELEFLVRYLAIEKWRFGDRLTYSIEVPTELEECLVPFLLLQPLIENAVRYGIEPKIGGGHIDVIAFRTDSSLDLKISDNGPGMPKTVSPRVGLTNTRERLRELYGDAASLEIASSNGTTVEIRLPYRMIP